MTLLRLTTIKTVISFPYYLLASSIATMFWILFNYFDQHIFFSPYLAFYIPKEGTVDFILSSIISIMLGIVLSLNTYHIKGKLFTGKSWDCNVILPALPGVMGTLSSVCLGCSVYMGAFVVSLSGSIGIGVLSVLASYNLPIRLISLTLLAYSLYFLNKSINNNRKIFDIPVVHKDKY